MGNEIVNPEPAVLLSRREIHNRIDGMAVSADAKAILSDIADLTVTAGGTLIEVGRKILSFIFDMVRKFPNTTFAVIAAYVVTALLASVPMLGPVLSAVAGPLVLALGITAGMLADLKERAFTARVEQLEKDLNALGPVANG